MRWATLILTALLLSACGEDRPAPVTPPSPPAPTSPTVEATPPPAPVEAPSVVRPAAPPRSPETIAETRRLVREGRALEHEGNHAGALERFDAALRLLPSQPRVLCEAGFVAHRAGRTELAARRIDTALAVFGSPSSVSAHFRVPLAMCLYNRGLVAEAMSDPRAAEDAFASSLALRPNATVEAALTRARAARAAAPGARPATPTLDADRSTVGGVALGDGYRLLTAAPSQYGTALRSGLRGYHEWEDAHAEPGSTVVHQRAALAESGHPPIVIHDASARGTPMTTTYLTIGWYVETGYQTFLLELASTNNERFDDVVDDTITIDAPTAQWYGDVIRIDVSVTQRFYVENWDDECADEISSVQTTEHVVLCRQEDTGDDAFVVCVDLPVGLSVDDRSIEGDCTGELVETDEVDDIDDTRRLAEISMADGGVTVERGDDDIELPDGLSEGFMSWDDVFMGDALMMAEWVTDQDDAEAAAEEE